ncbi:MAG: hypothetical protein WD267_00600 [Balneolales bacterium]
MIQIQVTTEEALIEQYLMDGMIILTIILGALIVGSIIHGLHGAGAFNPRNIRKKSIELVEVSQEAALTSKQYTIAYYKKLKIRLHDNYIKVRKYLNS